MHRDASAAMGPGAHAVARRDARLREWGGPRDRALPRRGDAYRARLAASAAGALGASRGSAAARAYVQGGAAGRHFDLEGFPTAGALRGGRQAARAAAAFPR